MIKEAIQKLVGRHDLSRQEMVMAMQEILSGGTDISDIVAFLTGLADKGETVDELTAAVSVMVKYIDPIIVDREHILDTCGTGGDKKGTFNISTLVALVAAGAGVTVAKHGNRSVSSKCGSADVLEALGVNINMGKPAIQRCLEEVGIAFLFAPNLHPAMKHVMPARKQIARRTMFNILGPLINPARATNQLIGVYSPEWTGVLARVLRNLGTEHVLVVHGKDGLDEVTTTDATFIAEYHRDNFKEYLITPEEYGIARARPEELLGGTLAENVRIAHDVLGGKPGAQRDIVLLNAGCALYAANSAGSIQEGINRARVVLDSGKALEKLQLLKECSNIGKKTLGRKYWLRKKKDSRRQSWPYRKKRLKGCCKGCLLRGRSGPQSPSPA
ncbi:MAG: anthranilate phosphoribosyltransferase [Candidatus Gracilibacteria bacterium]|nr:anthranilate phosphoribosyltransferase [Candidatus Gracilibacteria bacterium]